MVATVLRRLFRHIPGVRPRRVSRCVRLDLRAESDIRSASHELAPAADMEPAALQVLLRELVSLNTPALFLNLVQPGARVRVMLQPWEGRSVRLRGENYFVDAGSDAPEGIEAFTYARWSHVTALYPTAPDHPVYAISIENQGPAVYFGEVPPWLTHVTIVANGRVVTRSERLLHERGLHVWAA